MYRYWKNVFFNPFNVTPPAAGIDTMIKYILTSDGNNDMNKIQIVISDF